MTASADPGPARDVTPADSMADYVFRQDWAYGGPYGSWAERWLPFVCKHEHVRCTHGDEIIGRRWRRRVCMDCGRALRGDLPDECAFTGRLHPSAVSRG